MAVQKKTKQLNIRITPELRQRIDVVLEEADISDTKWLTRFIEYDVRRREKAMGIAAPKKKVRIPRAAPKSRYDWENKHGKS